MNAIWQLVPVEVLNTAMNGVTVYMLGRAIRDLKGLKDEVEGEIRHRRYARRNRPDDEV